MECHRGNAVPCGSTVYVFKIWDRNMKDKYDWIVVVGRVIVWSLGFCFWLYIIRNCIK